MPGIARISFAAVTLMALAVAPAAAGSPALVNFQGLLKDTGGAPTADSTYSVLFTIYDAPAAGNAIWSETQPVTTQGGLFAILLGAVNPLVDSVFNGTTRYLGVTVGGDPEIAPRAALVSVPYAQRVGTVDGASGGVITSKVSIGPGHTNTGTDAFVAGRASIASGNYATVSGGQYDTASGAQATVGGGYRNVASGSGATIGGGSSNRASNLTATVGGGYGNVGGGHMSTVGGGFGDTASGAWSTVGGGNLNTASGAWSTVGGGNLNTASGKHSTVSGGTDNTASGDSATVGGGSANTAGGLYATVGGGFADTASGRYSTIGGGQGNTASATGATVSGGEANSASQQLSTIGGGQNNSASGPQSTVAGGRQNIASDTGCTVSGGVTNTASGLTSAIGGGRFNVASGYAAKVSGGYKNVASGDLATVGGGLGDTASGSYATVVGGYGNVASGVVATICGGEFNSASGAYSLAAGRNAKALHQGAFVWGDASVSDVSSTQESQFTARTTGGARFFSNEALTAGVTLSPGGGSWASVSDRNLKTNCVAVNEEDVLARVVAMPMTTWNYTSQDESIRHMGPMAQDFSAAFGLGEDDTHISTIDADGVALAAIQGLNLKLEAQLKQKDAEIAALREELDGVKELVAGLAARLPESVDARLGMK